MRIFFGAALGVRLAAGMVLGWVYHQVYGVGDTLYLFDYASRLLQYLHEHPAAWADVGWADREQLAQMANAARLEPRTAFFVKWITAFAWLGGGDYWAASCWFSFLSFLSAWFLCRQLAMVLPDLRLAAVFTFLFWPSTVFWSSGIVKESLATAGLFFMSYVLVKWYWRQRIFIFEWALGLLALWLVWNLKYYWLAAFAAVVATTIVTVLVRKHLWPVRNRGAWLWLAVLVVMVALASALHPNFYPHRLAGVIIDNYQQYQQTVGHSTITYHGWDGTIRGLAASLPEAWAAAWFRPWPWEATGIGQVLLSIENTALAVLLLVAGLHYRRFFQLRWWPLILSVLVYSACLAVFLGLSTPNLGTLARYRVGFLPFLACLAVAGSLPAMTGLWKRLRGG